MPMHKPSVSIHRARQRRRIRSQVALTLPGTEATVEAAPQADDRSLLKPVCAPPPKKTGERFYLALERAGCLLCVRPSHTRAPGTAWKPQHWLLGQHRLTPIIILKTRRILLFPGVPLVCGEHRPAVQYLQPFFFRMFPRMTSALRKRESPT